jgi:hypothetical protein
MDKNTATLCYPVAHLNHKNDGVSNSVNFVLSQWTDFGGNEGLCEVTDYDSLNQSCYLNAVDNCMTADKCAVATYTDEYCGNSVSDISTTPSQGML